MCKLNKHEVRIGNYFTLVDSFSCRENDEICQISASDFEDNDFMWDRKITIEISQKNLKKFGFEINKAGTFILKLELDRSLIAIEAKDGFYFELVQLPEMSCEDMQVVPLRKLDYVHELQNLFFILSGGKELVFYTTEP